MGPHSRYAYYNLLVLEDKISPRYYLFPWLGAFHILLKAQIFSGGQYSVLLRIRKLDYLENGHFWTIFDAHHKLGGEVG